MHCRQDFSQTRLRPDSLPASLLPAPRRTVPVSRRTRPPRWLQPQAVKGLQQAVLLRRADGEIRRLQQRGPRVAHRDPHAHRADDILTAVRIAREFGLKLTLDHCTDGELIADELAKEQVPVFVGPSFGGKTKVELRNKSFTTAGTLYRAGLTVSIITDAPVIPLQYLPLAAGLAASAGLPMEEAWHAITINPARSLGIDARVGSLEPGKDADLVLWTADPLTTIGGEAWMTFVNGEVVYRAE